MSLWCLCVKCDGSEPEHTCENAILDAFVKARSPLITKNKIKKAFNIDYIAYGLLISVFLIILKELIIS